MINFVINRKADALNSEIARQNSLFVASSN